MGRGPGLITTTTAQDPKLAGVRERRWEGHVPRSGASSARSPRVTLAHSGHGDGEGTGQQRPVGHDGRTDDGLTKHDEGDVMCDFWM